MDPECTCAESDMGELYRSKRDVSVMLIVPPAIGHPDRFAHLGVASLVAFLRSHGTSAEAANLSATLYSSDRALYRRLYDVGSLERFWPQGAWGFSSSYVDDVLSGAFDRGLAAALAAFADSAVAGIVRERPMLVGISVIQSNIIAAAAIGERLVDAGVPVVCGGPACADRAIAARLLNGASTLVVQGEGEQVLADLARRLASGACVERCSIVAATQLKDLDALPFPELCSGHLDSIPTATSRGCVNRCHFCEESVYWHSSRRRSPASVVAEIVHQTNRHSTRHVHFDDSLINHDSEWLHDVCARIVATVPGLRWDAYARPSGLDSRLLAAMAHAGCAELHFGIEHFSQTVADVLGKHEDVQQAEQVVSEAIGVGIRVKLLLIEGIPGETTADHQMNLATLARLLQAGQGMLDLSVNPLMITPQTAFGRTPGRYGIRLIPDGRGEVYRAEFEAGPSRDTAMAWCREIWALRNRLRG